MKTMDELYNEIQSNEVMKESFIAAARENRLADFLREHDCTASVADVMEYINGVREGEVSDDDLDSVAGGNCGFHDPSEAMTCTCAG